LEKRHNKLACGGFLQRLLASSFLGELLTSFILGELSWLLSAFGSGGSRSIGFTISSASRASVSGVLGGFCAIGSGAKAASVVPLASKSASLKMHIRVKTYSMQKIKICKQVSKTYADALFTASFLKLNLGGGLLIMVPPLLLPASSTLELLAGADLYA